MPTVPAPPRFSRTPHLVGLVAETERLAQAVAGAPADARAALRDGRLDVATVATLRLDGSPLTAPPDVAGVVIPDPSTVEPSEVRPGTWLDAMRSRTDEELADEAIPEVQAYEFLGARAGLASDDLADDLLVDPAATLSTLHRRVTAGLLDEEHAGQPRRSEQAVHDGSTGRIIFFPSDPATIPRDVALLAGWIVTDGAREHGLVVSGVLQHELLRIHPFEAANGRLARTAARLVLRSRGLDPDGLGMPEAALAQDAIGYHDEIARTVRRRDLTIWLERWGEAVAAGLRTAAAALGVPAPEVPAGAARWVAERPAFTIADYRADLGVGPEAARTELGALLDAGLITRVLGSRGLRFRTVTP
ncbi:MAG: Fic family protein [Actinobacteria bacterium]|nr:Fic family protein [Actinomycetota bacterium]